MKPIPYGRQNITDDDINAVIQALNSDFLTQGPRIAEFETAFAHYVGSDFAVAVSNGTAALHLCALALEVNSTANVITVPITFAASANCIRYCNGNIFFADIDPDTFCIDVESVEKLISSKPAGFFNGIIPVDFAGYPVHLSKLRDLANKHGMWIIEDACHAPGGYFIDDDQQEQKCGSGSFADLAIFSFHPVKHIACGEGGMITTNSRKLYDRLLLLRTHGITKDPKLMTANHGGWYYEMQELGFNYRITDFQAALGTSQLQRADEGLTRRRTIAEVYYNAFKDIKGIRRQSGVVPGHAYHLYIIEVEQRKEMYDFLKSKSIFAQVHYVPVHTFPYYRSLEQERLILPNSEAYYEGCLSLPMYPTLTNQEQQYVIDTVKDFFSV